jgi:Zn-finger nucleic acid-binding protein
MKCPTDETALVMSERSGIEIDYCPTCRGVWLDRGELDKIVERSLGDPPTGQNAVSQSPSPMPYQDRGGHHSSGGYDQYGRKRKKESWLSELFD